MRSMSPGVKFKWAKTFFFWGGGCGGGAGGGIKSASPDSMAMNVSVFCPLVLDPVNGLLCI